ncbi:MAG: hypothetical protein K2M10_03845, partial [Muribaculaceae bacterium]|nr:hypothetical protein [Muribaculaceae bacterium]
MLEEDSYISYLIFRHIVGSATPEEEGRLMEWIEKSEENRRLFDSLTDIGTLSGEFASRNLINTERPARDMEMR